MNWRNIARNADGGTMSLVRPIFGWRATAGTGARYEALLRAMGTPAFGPAVRDAVMSVASGIRRLYLFEAQGQDSSAVHYFSGEPGLEELLPTYRRRYLRQDPVWEACLAARRSGEVVCQTVRPADIASGEFRRRVFDDAGIVERVSVIQRGPAGWRGMNVARHSADGAFNDAQVDALVALACLVLPMVPLNWRHRPDSTPGIAELEQRLAARCAALTPRELQVCACAAAGMSVAATAQQLAIARSSVLTYRQRAYQRLGVASPLELRALVTH
jgi:DNA-binding CsgD family transcriptional regulator